MAKKTALEEVRERMKEMMGTKSADLYKIAKMRQEAGEKIKNAEQAMKQATEAMDVDAYEEARQTRNKAQTALEMYNGRYEQIRTQEYISEEESDKVISSLLGYEQTLKEGFKFAAAEPLKKLSELLKAYRSEVAETERVLTSWQRDIHASYRSDITTYTDPVTGERTNRSPKPVPVHPVQYFGCTEARQLDEYLKTAGWIEDYTGKETAQAEG